MSATAIRGKDWIFTAFWAACFEASTAPKCYVHIPLTVLFKDGKPNKALHTDSEGIIKRVNFDEINVDRLDNERGFRGESLKIFRILRKLLIEYNVNNGYSKVQIDNNEESFICNVFYVDEQMEQLTLSNLDTLLRNEAWRKQVLIIQGYVPFKSMHVGNYSQAPQIRSKLSDLNTETADNFARAIAKYAERAYLVSSNLLLNQENTKAVSLKVQTMQCKFALDYSDKVIFLYCEYTAVEIENARKEIEDYMIKEKEGRNESAAIAVSNELLALLVHARTRGLTLEQAFAHFDVTDSGFVDTDMLIDGMAKLGIGVTYPVGEAVLQVIGGIGSSFISISDFSNYFLSPADVELFNSIPLTSRTKSKDKASNSKNLNKNIQHTNKVNKKVKIINEQLLPPMKDNLSINKDFMNLEASQSINNDWQQLQYDQEHVAGSSVISQQNIVSDSTQMELPLPLSAYEAALGGSADTQKNLPTWAAKRSHRALKQLQKAQKRSLDKHQSNISDTSTLGDEASNFSNNLHSINSKEKSSFKKDQRSPNSRSPSPQKPNDEKNKVNVTTLSLNAIVTSMSEDLSRNADELLHVDHGVIMTYRLLIGSGNDFDKRKTHEKTDSLRYKSHLKERETNLNKAMFDSDHSNTSNKPNIESKSNDLMMNDEILSFTLVVIPDLFMTLDTLQTYFKPLLSKYPYAQLLLVGLPGLPNTIWPNDWVLNSDLQSRSIAKLLQHLVQTEKIHKSNWSDSPIFFMGFGTSVHPLSRFITSYLPGIPELRFRIKAVCAINGLLRYNKKFRNICRDLRNSMASSNPHEVNELISSLHFYDDYVTFTGKNNVLDKFWSTRRSFQIVENQLSNSTEKSNLGLFGIMEQIKAILISTDSFDGAQILMTDIPLLVIQSTEDVFIDPKNAALFSPDLLPPTRNLVSDISDALDLNSVHVSWLKSGHEVLQERTSFILGFVSQLAQLCGIQPVETIHNQGAIMNKQTTSLAQNKDEHDEIFDVLKLAARDNEVGTNSVNAVSLPISHLKTDSLSPGQFKVDQIVENKISELDNKEVEVVDLQAEEDALRAEQEEQRKYNKQRNADNKLRKSQLALERKKRDLKVARENQMEVIYLREQEEAERKFEAKELTKMRKEDLRSKYAYEYFIECQIASNSSKLAKARAAELARYRKEEAIKRVEENMARQRSERIEARRQKAIELVNNIEKEELVLNGEREGGYDMPEDRARIAQAIEASSRLMRDLLECKQKSIEALKRQKTIEEKTELFRKQLYTVENDERRLRRAIRLIEINPTIVGEGLNPEAQLVELRSSLAAKQETLVELTALATQREAQLNAANRSAQYLKVAMQERDRLMNHRVQEMYQIETELTTRIGAQKIEKERLIILRDRIRMNVIRFQKRIDMLEKELTRIRDHKGKLIDTDVWVEGVMQRCVTKELKNHLKKELKLSKDSKDIELNELSHLRDQIFNTVEMLSKLKRDLNKIVNVAKVLFKQYKKFNEVSISEIMNNLNIMQKRAEKSELRNKKDADLERIFLGSESNNIADKIRLKDSEVRTKDERQFVGLDLVMNPEAYMHISIVEAEQMQFDEDYQCGLSKSDLEKILKLPEQISLALPFLHTVQEVNAHRLLNTFLRGKSEQYFKNRDYLGLSPSDENKPDDHSQVTMDDLTFMYSNSSVITKAAINSAEIIHDMLIRESLRDRLRTAAVDEFLTEDEQKWLLMDKILSPHVYDITEQLDPFKSVLIKPERSVENTLSTSVKNKNQMKVSNRERRKVDTGKDGDQYEDLRTQFTQGEDVFSYDWKCPFNREQLLALRSLPLTEIHSEEAVFARSMMDKYYVDDKESIIGHATLKVINEISGNIARIIRVEDEEEIIELESLRKSYEEELNENILVDDTNRKIINENKSKKDSDLDSDGIFISRIWGSWLEVHPASAGKESQISYFQKSTFDPSRDNPASFALRHASQNLDDNDSVNDDVFEDNQDADIVQNQFLEKGLNILNGKQDLNKSKRKTDLNSNVYIAESIKELALCIPHKVRGKAILLMQDESILLYETKNESLQARQSKSHYFTVTERENLRVLDLTISILFKGDFGGSGYKLGRLAAGLFKLPTENKTSALPQPVGFAPYDLQSPNLPNAMGRLVILHKPKVSPLQPGTFQIVIGAASNTKYSIEVSSKVAKVALPVVDDAIKRAKEMQGRLPVVLVEIDSIQESIRLAERKLLICEKMIEEAELESERCHKGIRICRRKIEKDDEDFLLMEDERRSLVRECGIFEIEYAQWTQIFATRSREKDDIKEGIKVMYQFKRDKLKEKEEIKVNLESSRRDLPSCIAVLRNTVEAVNTAISLNTTLEGVTEETNLAATGNFGGGMQVSTPAEDTRRHLKQHGFKALSLEEQQWCVLDQALNPSKYEWMYEQEDKERIERENAGKPPKVKKYNAAVEEFRLSKHEINYILDTPFSMLSRKDVIVRKLLTKYHDDKDALKKAIAAVAYSFDPHLAERTRSKNPAAYTKEEASWSSVDRVLHPEIWAFYVNRSENFLDRHAKESMITDKKKKKKKNKDLKSDEKGKLEEEQSMIESEIVGGQSLSVGDENSSTFSSIVENTGVIMSKENISDLLEDRKLILQPRKSIGTVEDGLILKCPYDRDNILRIWRTPRHFLKDDMERNVFKLLQKYNGTYSSYMDAIAHAKRRQQNFVQEGKHIQWEKLGKLVSKDVDYRARELLREIDRATFTKNDWISSDVLHANDQQFPTRVLRMHLEEALDTLLSEQIKDRERADKIKVESSDSEPGDDDEDDDEDEDGIELDQLDENEINDPDIANKIKKRANRREKRKRKLFKLSEEKQVLKVKKVLQNKKTGVSLAEAILQNQLGVNGCLACRSKKCKWSPSVDVEVCTARINELDTEIERVRINRDSVIFESDVCLSAQLGGNRVFKRMALMDELTDERRELHLRLDLNNIDMELHDAFCNRKEFFESKFLHGYSLMLWTNNARLALESRHSRLCALSVAKEVVDDILDWMLEGWYFGERESQYKVLGYVPTIKSKGKIKAGQDQISSVSHVVAKMKSRAENRRKSIATAESTQGLMIEKAWEIENNSQKSLLKLKVARDGNSHEHLLNETENTLKFGIFMLTLMYFRAMTFLKREQKSWSGEGEEVGIKNKNKMEKFVTNERMRMIDEENRAIARKKKVDIVLARCKIGEQRRAEREAGERREAIYRMQAIIRRQRLELDCVCTIQKVYRGHIGRKAARRWALKRAELGAMNALLNSTAIAIQRVYRGYAARVYTIQKRTEMAHFIALMRVQEAQQDEEIYWQTHPWSRYKKTQKEWLDQKLAKYRNNETLGGSRLTAEEQARAEGKTLEQIKLEIDGLAAPDNDDDEEEDVVVAEEDEEDT